MHDGSLQFFDMPENVSCREVRSRVESLNGAQITTFIGDFIVEFWLDFTFLGHQFSVSNPMGELWFFAENASCPREILDEIIEHLLNKI